MTRRKSDLYPPVPTAPATLVEAGMPDVLRDYEALRRRAMQSLFESLDRLCEGTVVVDADARIVWINARYAARFGIAAPADAIGRAVEDVIPNSLMREVVLTGKPILLDLLEAGAQYFIVTRIPVKDERGQVIGAIGFALYDQINPLSPLFSKFLLLQEELAATRRSLVEARRAKYTFSNFIGRSPACMEVRRLGRRTAQLDSPVLLQGETGTGKELLAQAIHAASPRAHKPFVAVNAAAIPDTLLEAEFFGVAPGAYTGADRKGRDGKFALAEGGTLFLDEIGDLPLPLQAKLLRVLQEREFEPLGSNRIVKTDVRIVAATSMDLAALVEANRFRADLYYRLNVLSINVPPLRDRLADLPALCDHLLDEIALRAGQTPRELAPAALDLLAACRWPGNIRELRNVLEKAVLRSDPPLLTLADLRPVLPAAALDAGPKPSAPTALATSVTAEPPLPGPEAIRPYAAAMADFERQLLRRALAACGGRVSEAARRLGIGRATLYKKLDALGLTPSGVAPRQEL